MAAGQDNSEALREHITGALGAVDRTVCHPEDTAYLDACMADAGMHLRYALALLDDREEQERIASLCAGCGHDDPGHHDGCPYA